MFHRCERFLGPTRRLIRQRHRQRHLGCGRLGSNRQGRSGNGSFLRFGHARTLPLSAHDARPTLASTARKWPLPRTGHPDFGGWPPLLTGLLEQGRQLPTLREFVAEFAPFHPTRIRSRFGSYGVRRCAVAPMRRPSTRSSYFPSKIQSGLTLDPAFLTYPRATPPPRVWP